MSGIGETLAANNNVQGAGATIAEAWDVAVNAIADAAGVGAAIGVIDTIINILDPPAGSSQPSLQDLINKFDQFTTLVTNELNQIEMTAAGGQVQTWAHDLQQVLQGPEGPLSVIPEITDWKNNPGLPLPDDFNPSPSNCHIWARSALNQLIGETSGQPGVTGPPTPFWFIPPGDLPLFEPDNPWTYLGTGQMFNQKWEYPLEVGGPTWDNNPYTFTGAIGPPPPIPQFDLSAFNFRLGMSAYPDGKVTNDFLPTAVTGIPANNAFNPTWVLQQSLAAVAYYFLLCGAVLKSFPTDGSTANDFVGNGPTDANFLGGLSWYHDQIRAGIVCIAPPFPWDLLPIGPNNLIPASANAGISTWSVPCGLSANANSNPFEPSQGFYDSSTATAAAANAPASPWSRPFGALCNYNGFVAGYGGPQPSVDSYPDYVYPTPGQPVRGQPIPGVEIPPQPTPASQQWYTGFYGKYLVACLWRAKLVYNGMGLGDMWRTINNQYVMFGQSPRPGPCFGDWSLREAFRMLGSADEATFPLPYQQVTTPGIIPGATAPLSTKFTVRAFLQFMNSAAPTPPSPLHSLRAALQT
jgi:hypothetical protein